MTKLRAFFIHFSISFIIVSCLVFVMFYFWYPMPYFELEGGWDVLKILVGVDLVVGPVLTFVVYKPGKPSLKFDLACIALVQISALIYGGSVIYQERPAYIVYGITSFAIVPDGKVDREKIQYNELRGQGLFQTGPIAVYMDIPNDMDEVVKTFNYAREHNLLVSMLSEYYSPLKNHLPDISGRSKNMGLYLDKNPDIRDKLEKFLNVHGGEVQDYLYLPVTGRNKSMIIVINRADASVIGGLDINPWQLEKEK